ncbi:hypothetical protein R5R35_002107 [Gryllus longicercus]|uniref:Accessory gland protein n=1 Tax=Gryllus longicercus TaxID=2509291 RepID=A0AAN9VYQ1_9ORTH
MASARALFCLAVVLVMAAALAAELPPPLRGGGELEAQGTEVDSREGRRVPATRKRPAGSKNCPDGKIYLYGRCRELF